MNKRNRFLTLVVGIILYLPFIIGFIKAQTAENDTTIIELRQVQVNALGKVIGGTLPDSLDQKYFIDDMGKVYKHFNSLEQVLGHLQNDYYPRNKSGIHKKVIYYSEIKGSPPYKLDENNSVKIIYNKKTQKIKPFKKQHP